MVSAFGIGSPPAGGTISVDDVGWSDAIRPKSLKHLQSNMKRCWLLCVWRLSRGKTLFSCSRRVTKFKYLFHFGFFFLCFLSINLRYVKLHFHWRPSNLILFWLVETCDVLEELTQLVNRKKKTRSTLFQLLVSRFTLKHHTTHTQIPISDTCENDGTDDDDDTRRW